MILRRLFNFVILLCVLNNSWSQRRINGGYKMEKVQKRYMAYFVKSDESRKPYDNWACGGALVDKYHIITAAACLEEIRFLYAIAGYNIMVKTISSDPCTKWFRKKVTHTCTPKAYEFDYAKVHKWAAMDIGIAGLESPFQIKNGYCSYPTEFIPINYDPKYGGEGINAIVMGWGHFTYWRLASTNATLTRGTKVDKSCGTLVQLFMNEAKSKHSPEMQEIINRFMICTLGKGNFDSTGHLLTTISPKYERCGNLKDGECKENLESKMEEESPNIADYETGRRQGICQNDHGGPLVTWIGGKEYLIGVASVFRVNKTTCVGPFLFTSTHCNSAFLHCYFYKRRSGQDPSICNVHTKEQGFEMIYNNISWIDHPDGPADNEREDSDSDFTTPS